MYCGRLTQVVSMFGANLIKCQHLKSCLTPIYCGRLNWWACLAPVLQNVNFSSHVWRQSYKMSTSDVNFYSNFGANLTKCQLLNISIHIGQYQYWGLLRYWQYQYIHSSSIVLPNMGWGRINSGPLFCRMPRASGDPCRAFCTKTSAGRHGSNMSCGMYPVRWIALLQRSHSAKIAWRAPTRTMKTFLHREKGIVDSTWFVSGKNLARETFSGLGTNWK